MVLLLEGLHCFGDSFCELKITLTNLGKYTYFYIQVSTTNHPLAGTGTVRTGELFLVFFEVVLFELTNTVLSVEFSCTALTENGDYNGCFCQSLIQNKLFFSKHTIACTACNVCLRRRLVFRSPGSSSDGHLC